MITLHELRRRAAARAARVRTDGDGENGFVLVYVLAISMLVTMLVTTVTMAAAGNIAPAQRSAFSQAATAAAEGGIQAYLAQLTASTNCSSLTKLSNGDADCNGLIPGSTSGHVALTSVDTSHAFTTATQAWYTWTVLAATSSFVRVKSVGEIGSSSTAFHVKKTLVADITGGTTRDFLQYAYYSTYETLSSAEMQKEFGTRTIAFTSPSVLSDAGVSTSATSVTWGGAPSSGTLGTQWCDALYYTPGSDSSPNAATGGIGRYLQNSGLSAGYDWQESVTSASPASLTGAAHNGICQVDFTTGNHITGPVYSRDAFLLSYGTNNGTSHGSGPTFDDTVYSAWTTNDTPAANPPYNTFPIIGGGTNGGLNAPQSANFTLTLPSSVTGALTSNTATNVCIYSGPTRVYVNGAYAYITSPMTAANSSSVCTASTAPAGEVASVVPSTLTTSGTQLVGAGSSSVLEAKVPVANTLIYVKNASLASNATWDGQSIFAVTGTAGGTSSSTTTTTAADAGVANNGGVLTSLLGLVQQPPKADGAWTLHWAYDCVLLTIPCDSNSKNQANFEKDLGKTYTQFKAQVLNSDGTLKGPTTSSLLTDLTTQLSSSFTADGKTLFASSGAVPTPSSASSVAYYLSTSPSSEPTYATSAPSCVTGTASTPATDTNVTAPTLATGDPLLGQTSPGTSSTQTGCVQKQVTATVVRETATQDQCTHKNILNICDTWSYKWTAPTNQFDVTATRKQNSTVTSVVSGGTTSFPLSNDVTRYQAKQNGPGDAYLEGNVTGKLSVVSENDTIVTGGLTYGDSSSGTGVVAANNVRVYHPVKCVSALSTSTSPGYCPNDTTGLFPTSTLQFTSATFGSSHPSRQYQNLRPDLATLSVKAGVFALLGSFIVDNYNRGEGYGTGGSLDANGLSTMTLTGGVYQLHHGAAGVQWEIASSATTRPTSGYTTTITWDSGLQSRGLPYIPTPSGANGSRAWQVVSTSTASN